jgi:hypothetical protein
LVCWFGLVNSLVRSLALRGLVLREHLAGPGAGPGCPALLVCTFL